MPVDIQISDEDIAYAEKVLLPDGKHFDGDGRRFIKCLDTVDLQAVPGSGKTTVLLAKLLIIDRQLPFSDGSGILVISHTNAAVNEIHSRIGKLCPKLFSYPNFVGTIQAFVDTFLAIPFYASFIGGRPHRINNDIYWNEAGRFSECYLKGYSREEQNAAKYLLNMQRCCSTYRLSVKDGRVIPSRDLSGVPLTIRKPRGNDWSEVQKQRVVSWLVDFKWKILRKGILCYDDAYFLAELAVEKSSLFQTFLSRRFKYVFVDEMQDMAPHQNNLLEKLFGSANLSETIFQRIGDTDQAIFGGKNIIDTAGWQQHDEVLTLNNSLRLSPAVSRILAPFAYERGEDFQVNGLHEVDIRPHIIVYDDSSVEAVVERYAQLITDLQQVGKIPRNIKAPFKAVAWNSTWNETSGTGERNLRLINFCPSFQRSTLKKQVEFETLVDYLIYFDPDDRTLASARKAILGGVVQTLRFDGVVDTRSERHFTATSLINYFKYEYPDFYDRLNLFIFRWTLSLVKKNFNHPLRSLRLLIPKLIEHFDKTVTNSKDFLIAEPEENLDATVVVKRNPNTLTFDDLEIELGTVHSVKGQTHTATLYIESSYQKDGNGPNAKRYESQRLAAQFKGNRLPSTAGKRIKESARMVYVGFSRPTHLLAFAVHKERFDTYLADLDSDVWEIVKLCEERGAS